MIRFHVLSLLILQAARLIARGRLRDSVQRHPLSQQKNLPLSQLEVCIFWVSPIIFLHPFFIKPHLSVNPSLLYGHFSWFISRSCEYPTLLTLLLLVIVSPFSFACENVTFLPLTIRSGVQSLNPPATWQAPSWPQAKSRSALEELVNRKRRSKQKTWCKNPRRCSTWVGSISRVPRSGGALCIWPCVLGESSNEFTRVCHDYWFYFSVEMTTVVFCCFF